MNLTQISILYRHKESITKTWKLGDKSYLFRIINTISSQQKLQLRQHTINQWWAITAAIFSMMSHRKVTQELEIPTNRHGKISDCII